MATAASGGGGGRGRRKQAKPQRKGEPRVLVAAAQFFGKIAPNGTYIVIDLEANVEFSTVLTDVENTISPMSPDPNHNLPMKPLQNENYPRNKLNGNTYKDSSVHLATAITPAGGINAVQTLRPQQLRNRETKTGGSAEDIVRETISVRAAVGEATSSCEDDDEIRKYMKRSDTVVIYPEPVPSLTNGVAALIKDDEDPTGAGNTSTTHHPAAFDHFIKCPQCQKGYQTFQALKEHLAVAHPDLLAASTDDGGGGGGGGGGGSLTSPSLMTPGAVSPPPSLLLGGVGGGSGPYGCAQCSTSFASKDQLEKHELLHSPNAQVSCKICNKTFANVYRLQRHMISHDESAILRKFKCTECDKAFKFKHHLKEHIRIHSGEKPFECGNCGKRFSHSGSYSSHMTSKKCLVMNLKLGRARAPTSSVNTTGPNGSVLHDKPTSNPRGGSSNTKRSPSLSSSSSSHPLNNNNITTTTNHNNNNNNINPASNPAAFLPILPKYSDSAVAAAFLQNSMHHQFYMTPPALLSASVAASGGHNLPPYSIPTLEHILDQLKQSAASPHRSALPEPSQTTEDTKPEYHGTIRVKQELLPPISKSNSSSCDNLVMDEEDDERKSPPPVVIKQEKGTTTGNDLQAVKRILETVNATVTQQLFAANMQKFQDSLSSDSYSRNSNHSNMSAEDNNTTITNCSSSCQHCKRTFPSQVALEDHDCAHSEGLAAKLEDAISTKQDQLQEGSNTSSVVEDQDQDLEKRGDDFDLEYSESVTTTDQLTEDGRKVRVRSLISDEQLTILKDNYALNQRPKRDELAKIADQIRFPVRVVQVWFQNTRARDRREGRIIHAPYTTQLLPRYTNNTYKHHEVAAITPIRQKQHIANNAVQIIKEPEEEEEEYSHEQPLDLSTRRDQHHHSRDSSPGSSPNHHHNNTVDSGDDAMNLSQRSSRSPTPYYHHLAATVSNGSSIETRRTPSPIIDYGNNNNSGSRLAQILAQPAHRLANLGLVAPVAPAPPPPMEQLMQFGTAVGGQAEFPSLQQLIISSGRLSSVSPSVTEKRSWMTTEMEGDSQDEGGAAGGGGKRIKLSPGGGGSPLVVMKGLGSPMLGSQDGEAEGQFTCDQCDKAFNKQSSLARHKYEHSGQRPHKCDECTKAFKHKHHLTEHKRLHSGEKPFQCSKCLKRFSHSGSYSQHMNHRYSYCKPYRE